MKLKRFFGAFSVTFLAGEVIIAGLIVAKFLVELAFVLYYGSRVSSFGPSGAAVSPIILAAAGILLYPRHSALCMSVNMTAKLKLVTLSALSALVAVFYAATDIFMAQNYFHSINKYFELELFYGDSVFGNDYPETLFSVGGAFLTMKTAVFYHVMFMFGYTIRHFFCAGKKAIIPTVIFLCFFALSVIGLLTYNAELFLLALLLSVPVLPSFVPLALTQINSVPVYCAVAGAVWLTVMLLDLVILERVKSVPKRTRKRR